jgi:hypothetical protein
MLRPKIPEMLLAKPINLPKGMYFKGSPYTSPLPFCVAALIRSRSSLTFVGYVPLFKKSSSLLASSYNLVKSL